MSNFILISVQVSNFILFFCLSQTSCQISYKFLFKFEISYKHNPSRGGGGGGGGGRWGGDLPAWRRAGGGGRRHGGGSVDVAERRGGGPVEEGGRWRRAWWVGDGQRWREGVGMGGAAALCVCVRMLPGLAPRCK
jgi:hypothetical protein